MILFEQYTKGWSAFRDYVSSLNLAELSDDAGVSIDAITFLAEKIGTIHPMYIWIGFGLQRHINGGQNMRAIHALAAMTGNIGTTRQWCKLFS